MAGVKAFSGSARSPYDSAMATPAPIRRSNGAARQDEHLRLITKVARLYHEHGLNQPEIARRLHVSQARISRLLKQAQEQGIVRTIVTVPGGVWTEVEDRLEQGYGLREAIVVECLETSEEGIAYDLGVATATYLETTLTGGDVVGVSSWSGTLLAASGAMRPLARSGASRVVQLVGGVGNPRAEAHAAHLTRRFSDLMGARPTFLLAPGIATTAEAREAMLKDEFVQEAIGAWDEVTLALVGIGALEPSSLLQSSGNIFSERELRALGKRGAVGDVCLRFFDAGGEPIASDFDQRVIGVRLEQLKLMDRSVGVAGGERKYEAIRAAVRGGWVNVLITDHITAERLVDEHADGADAARRTPGVPGARHDT
jgi:DNA-binding transcriptional regulator LsrR (DeoR family)